MQKKIIQNPAQAQTEDDWLDLENIAHVEITSENQHHPIESALISGSTSGWVAGEAGKQTIRIVFKEAHGIQKIMLKFVESKIERTQEYTLSWFGEDGTAQEIARQQWNFSPNGSTSEHQIHHVNLADVAAIELTINPDIGGGSIMASLEELKVA